MSMSDPARSKGMVPERGVSDLAAHYKRDFWDEENLKFSEPWYRLEKSARIISRLAGRRECTLLDVGCGPATLMRLLPANIRYYGIDIAIHNPAPNLIEADLLESEIAFGDKRFDLIAALGVFEYVSQLQSRKFSEIAKILNYNGKFIVTYTNFGHRKKRIYEAFSNVQTLDSFRQDLRHYFTIDKSFPASHNWKHSQPSRKLVKAANMHVSVNVPIISPVLAVDYFFICSPRRP
jgi:SAM-dependent methyltransferase